MRYSNDRSFRRQFEFLRRQFLQEGELPFADVLSRDTAQQALDPIEGEGLVGGTATGPLVGGNLKVVVASLGTPWEIDTRGAILFLGRVADPSWD